MSRPSSLRAAFQACQPLRVWHHHSAGRASIDISQKSFPRSRNQSCYRSFHAAPNPLLVELPLSPSEIPRGSSHHESPNESPEKQTLPTTATGEQSSSTSSSSPSPTTPEPPPRLRPPRAVQASYLQPLRRPPPIHGHPVCTLQLRSFSVRNVEFMTDFAMRAAFYLHLRAKGPVPLPKIIQRWTVLKSNFVNKEAQENFERITLRRLIQIQDGHPHVVQIWLAYLRKYAYWGVGMKANIWEFEGLDVAGNMDKAYSDVEKELDEKLSTFGYKHNVADKRSVPNWLRNQGNNLPGMPMMELRADIKREKQPHLTEGIY